MVLDLAEVSKLGGFLNGETWKWTEMPSAEGRPVGGTMVKLLNCWRQIFEMIFLTPISRPQRLDWEGFMSPFKSA